MADNFNFESIKDIGSLKVHGFVASKTLKTKVVKMNIKIGGKPLEITAIVLDNIRTNFNIPKTKKITGIIVKGIHFCR